MTATRPQPGLLTGKFLRVEPLTQEFLPQLYAAIGHPIVFAGGYGGGPDGYRDSEEGFIEWAKNYFAWDTGNPYVITLVGGDHDGAVVGTTTLTEFDLPREEAHLGWTAYDPRVWGTAVNPEVKLLVLGLAFDHGFGRVKIQADARNDRSRAAITRLGATFEGIVRRDRQRADGSWRDTALFSITIDDWPKVREGLQSRLAVQGEEPVQFRARNHGTATA